MEQTANAESDRIGSTLSWTEIAGGICEDDTHQILKNLPQDLSPSHRLRRRRGARRLPFRHFLPRLCRSSALGDDLSVRVGGTDGVTTCSQARKDHCPCRHLRVNHDHRISSKTGRGGSQRFGQTDIATSVRRLPEWPSCCHACGHVFSCWT